MAAPCQQAAAAAPPAVRLHHSLPSGVLSMDAIACMVKAHLGTDSDAERLKTFFQTSQRSLWVKHSAELGTLHNGKVMVGLSAISALPAGGAPVAAAAAAEPEQQRVRFLGLFATQAIAKGSWVTAYGGIQQWPGARRSQNVNTHSRRIPDSSWIWNGRPWALLLSSAIASQTPSSSSQPQLQLRFSDLNLVNVLLQLEHEAFHVGRSDCSTQVTGGGGTDGNSSDSDPEHSSPACTANSALPSCSCCGVELGLLPSEFAAILAGWTPQDRQRYADLLLGVRNRVEQEGVGYMANTSSNKADLNVVCIAVSPYTAAMAAIHPKQLIYQAARNIAAGEEILVAYKNNESKLF